MIIDTHVHLIIPGFVKSKFILGNARMASNIYNRVHDLLKAKVDPDCSRLIETMDKAGIDKSVIFGVDWAYAVTGEPRVKRWPRNMKGALSLWRPSIPGGRMLWIKPKRPSRNLA
jgi:hypothetical protein